MSRVAAKFFRLFEPLTRRGELPVIRRWAGIFALLTLSLSCAISPQTRQLLAQPPDIPSRVELSQVPFFPQLQYHCGPAALASIISYRGQAVAPDQVTPLIYVPGLQGSLQIEVVAATRQFDLLPVPLQPSLEALLLELVAGNPVFVLQNLGLDSLPVWHYEVVIGYDLDEGMMILRSGLNQRLLRPFSVFERTWQRAGYWALVVVSPDAIPASASRKEYLATVIDMEQVGRVKTAHRAYLSATRRWPDSLLASSGLGNTAYQLGDYATAALAFENALKLNSERAEIWNNLAYARAQLGLREQSMTAIRRALQLDPQNANYRDSLGELANWPQGLN